jgi:hypothetical protein
MRSASTRDWRDERDGRGFEVRSLRFSELRTPNFERLVAPFLRVSGKNCFTGHKQW